MYLKIYEKGKSGNCLLKSELQGDEINISHLPLNQLFFNKKVTLFDGTCILFTC